MKTCSDCGLDFPDELISEMAIGDSKGLHYIRVDGICGLKRMNEMHGMNRKRFDGPGAESLRQQAIRYNKQRNFKAKAGHITLEEGK